MRLLIPNVSTAAGRALARAGLLLSALLFLAGGGLGVYLLGLQPLWDAWRSRDWQPVTVVLEQVDLGTSPGAGNRGAQVAVSYRYRVAGREYQGSRYGPHVWMDNGDAQRAAYADLLYRRRAQAWVNPRDPGEALLSRELHWTVVALALPALGAAGLGALLLWAAVVGGRDAWRAARRRRRPV